MPYHSDINENEHLLHYTEHFIKFLLFVDKAWGLPIGRCPFYHFSERMQNNRNDRNVCFMNDFHAAKASACKIPSIET